MPLGDAYEEQMISSTESQKCWGTEGIRPLLENTFHWYLSIPLGMRQELKTRDWQEESLRSS